MGGMCLAWTGMWLDGVGYGFEGRLNVVGWGRGVEWLEVGCVLIGGGRDLVRCN